VALRGRTRSKSTDHLGTNWAPRCLPQGRWARGEAAHLVPRQHRRPRALGPEIQMQCDAGPGTNGRLPILYAMKLLVRNWIRRYRSTNIRIPQSVGLERNLLSVW